MVKAGAGNTLYYGDNLAILREEIGDESVDLIYLDPPINSNASYNVLFRAPEGHQSKAQIEAFEKALDTYRLDVGRYPTSEEGMAALLSRLPDGDLEEVRAAMERGMASVDTGEVTNASRSVELNGVAYNDGGAQLQKALKSLFSTACAQRFAAPWTPM